MNNTIQSFQGLRGIAIILIMVSHCPIIMNNYNNNIFMYAGGNGVELFIILGGIWHIIVRKKTLKKAYLRH